jgi:hypothetical protein
LLAFAAYEGFRVAFNGTQGRIEALIPDHAPWEAHGVTIWYTPLRKARELIEVADVEGGHWGGDEVMLDDIFIGDRLDPLKRSAGSHAGAMSILTGVACNESMRTGRPIEIADLLTGSSNSSA